MSSLDLPHLLGEGAPSVAQTRRAIRNELLARQSLAPTDHKAIRGRIDALLGEADTLREELKDNLKDEQKERRCIALITEAVFLASDDGGLHLLWLRSKCLAETRITRDTPLLPLALKAFGPYVYDGDTKRHRLSDKKVSRDYNAIRRFLSPTVLPADLVSKWNQNGRGRNVSSRRSAKPKRVTLTDNKFSKHLATQVVGTKSIALVEANGHAPRLLGMEVDPKILQAVIALINKLRAAAKKPPSKP